MSWYQYRTGASPHEVAARAILAAIFGDIGLAQHWLWWAEQYRTAGWMP